MTTDPRSAHATASPRGPGSGPAGPAGRGPGRAGGSRPRSAGDPRRVAAGLAAVWLETEAGLRGAGQLRRLITPLLDARLAELRLRPGPAGRLLRLSVFPVSPERVEAVATVRRGARITALGLSLVRSGDRWLLDDVVRPEAGPLPEPAFALPVDEPDLAELALEDPAPPMTAGATAAALAR
jgi:hypothetical protein